MECLLHHLWESSFHCCPTAYIIRCGLILCQLDFLCHLCPIRILLKPYSERGNHIVQFSIDLDQYFFPTLHWHPDKNSVSILATLLYGYATMPCRPAHFPPYNILLVFGSQQGNHFELTTPHRQGCRTKMFAQ